MGAYATHLRIVMPLIVPRKLTLLSLSSLTPQRFNRRQSRRPNCRIAPERQADEGAEQHRAYSGADADGGGEVGEVFEDPG